MTEPPVYFAFTDGRQIGPIRFAELADLVARGVLHPEDLVWQSGTPEWVAASSVLAFPKEARNESRAFGDDTFSSRTATKSGSRTLTRSGPVSRQAPAPAPQPVAPPTDPPAASAPALRPGEMLSFARLLDPETFGSPVSWILLIFGLGPLLFSLLVEDPLLKLRLFAFICGAAWTAFFVGAFRTSDESPRLGVGLFFGSALGGFVLLTLLSGVPPISTVFHLASSGTSLPARFLAAVLGVALLEELLKLAGLLAVARLGPGIPNARAGTFYGLMSGVGFGVWQSVSGAGRIATDAATAAASGGDLQPVALVASFAGQALQAFAIPLLHAVWTGVAGYFLGLGPRSGRDPLLVAGTGFAIVVLAHGLTEAFTAVGWPFAAVLAAAFSLLLFLACQRNAERLEVRAR